MDTVEIGLLVCAVKEETALPSGNRAIPWRQFADWIMSRLAEPSVPDFRG
jgi:hypothetical protein